MWDLTPWGTPTKKGKYFTQNKIISTSITLNPFTENALYDFIIETSTTSLYTKRRVYNLFNFTNDLAGVSDLIFPYFLLALSDYKILNKDNLSGIGLDNLLNLWFEKYSLNKNGFFQLIDPTR